MKWIRRIITIAITLAFGAIGTLVVAWAQFSNAVTGGTSPIPATIMSSPIGAWPELTATWPPPRVGVVSCRAFDSTTWVLRAQWTPTGFVTNETTPDVSRFRQEVRIGFPFRCVAHSVDVERWHATIPPGHFPAPKLDDGIPLLGVRMPGRPIWPGFLVNACVLALAVWLAEWALRRFVRWLAPRRRLRLNRGLCGGCGYERRGLPAHAPCPECGEPPRA